MENNTFSKIVTTAIEENSLEVANHQEQKQKDKMPISWNYRTQDFELLLDEVNNFQDCSIRICRNWLKAHESESFCSENIERYTKIVILLRDVVELLEKIKIKIQGNRSQKLEIFQIVEAIVSDCLDIELKQVTPKASLVNDLGMDSLSWQELLITLEKTFAISISDEIAETLTTVQEIVDRIVLILQAENKRSLQLQL